MYGLCKRLFEDIPINSCILVYNDSFEKGRLRETAELYSEFREHLLNHDLIINPTNPQMVAGAGVSGAIFKKAGIDILEQYTQEHFEHKAVGKIVNNLLSSYTDDKDINIDLVLYNETDKQYYMKS